MKFVCERCGKKYATAEDPAPGRVYKLKCKACGHVIAVRAPAAGGGASSGARQERRETTPMPAIPPLRPSDPPDVPLEIGAPEPAREPDTLEGYPGLPLGDSTTEISMSSISPSDTPTPPASLPGTGAGYVDLFADIAPASPPLEEKKDDDPFLAAARASLPDKFSSGGSSPDIFGSMRSDRLPPLDPEASGHRPAPPTPKIPVIPKPPQQKSGAPIALIVGGIVVLVGILAFTLFGTGKKAPRPAQPAAQAQAQAPAALQAQPPVQAQAPAPAPPTEPAAQPPPAAAVVSTEAATTKGAEEQQRAREEQRRRERAEARERERQERAAREERDRVAREAKNREGQERAARERDAKEARDRERAERAARERDAKEAKQRERQERERQAREAKAERDRQARDAKAERERQAAEAKAERERQVREAAERERQAREADKVASASEPEGGLTPAQMERVLSSTKRAFDGCIQAAKGSDVKLDGRRVMLRLNIQTTGAVTYPTLDDVTLNGTELGTCLKNAARLMVFPKFKGDTMHVEVPLVLQAR